MKNRGVFKLLGSTNKFFNSCFGIKGEPEIMFGSSNPLNSESIPHDTICVKDVSGSMSRQDCKPSRLEASKMATEEYVRQKAVISPDDRIAIVSFTTQAKTVLPFTSVRETEFIVEQLKSLKAGGGTDIAEGLEEAKALLCSDPLISYQNQRLISLLVLTDGQGGHPINIAKELKKKGVLIEVIGIGGSRSEVNETLLRKVATTDINGFTHYRFIYETVQLTTHYQQLATGIVWRNRT